MNARCCLFLGLVLALGCSQGTTPPPVTTEQLKGRLEAAEAINNVAKRNEVLQAVAEDAADAGDSEIVKRVLDKMNNVAQKNHLASSCALKLAERGKSQDAVEVAKTITNVAKKNETLGKIAKGNK
jgi:hypothetical protein